MKHHRFLLALLLSLLLCLLIGCDLGTTPSPPSIPTLESPTALRVEGDTLLWNAIDHAIGYTVSIDDIESPCETNSYSVAALSDGAHTFRVRAKGDDTSYRTSAFCDTLTVHIKGGRIAYSVLIEITPDSTEQHYVPHGDTFALPNVTRPYYTGCHWMLGDKEIGASGETLTMTQTHDIVIHALWDRQYPEYTYISNATEFAAIAKDPDGKYMLINDIDLGGLSPLEEFNGELVGNGFKLSNFTLSRTVSEGGRWGLFSQMSGATLSNFTLMAEIDIYNEQNTSSDQYYVGCLAGRMYGCTLNDVSVGGHAKMHGAKGGTSYVGGFAGSIERTYFGRCWAGAAVYSAKGSAMAGGFAGCGRGANELDVCYVHSVIQAHNMVLLGYAYASEFIGECYDRQTVFNIRTGAHGTTEAWGTGGIHKTATYTVYSD